LWLLSYLDLECTVAIYRIKILCYIHLSLKTTGKQFVFIMMTTVKNFRLLRLRAEYLLHTITACFRFNNGSHILYNKTNHPFRTLHCLYLLSLSNLPHTYYFANHLRYLIRLNWMPHIWICLSGFITFVLLCTWRSILR